MPSVKDETKEYIDKKIFGCTSYLYQTIFAICRNQAFPMFLMLVMEKTFFFVFIVEISAFG